MSNKPEMLLDGMSAHEFALNELCEFQQATGCDTAAQYRERHEMTHPNQEAAEALAACPFCGAAAMVERVHTLTWHDRYGCEHCRVWFGSASEWNRRTSTPPAEPSKVEAALIAKLENLIADTVHVPGEYGQAVINEAIAALRSLATVASATTHPKAEPAGVPEGWKLVAAKGIDDLSQALERAERKGYLPDALADAWAAFDYSNAAPAAPQDKEADRG